MAEAAVEFCSSKDIEMGSKKRIDLGYFCHINLFNDRYLYLAGALQWGHSQVPEYFRPPQVQWMFFMQSLWPCNHLETWRLGPFSCVTSQRVS